MRRRITAFFMGAAVLTATLTAGQAAMAAEPQKTAIQPEKKIQAPFASSYPYVAMVNTVNGTNALVQMQLRGSDRTTPPVLVNNPQPFVRVYRYNMVRYLGSIERICVRRLNNAGISPDWRLHSIQVNHTRRAVFNAWIPAGAQWTCRPTQLLISPW
jgi:hypothetical protein